MPTLRLAPLHPTHTQTNTLPRPCAPTDAAGAGLGPAQRLDAAAAVDQDDAVTPQSARRPPTSPSAFRLPRPSRPHRFATCTPTGCRACGCMQARLYSTLLPSLHAGAGAGEGHALLASVQWGRCRDGSANAWVGHCRARRHTSACPLLPASSLRLPPPAAPLWHSTPGRLAVRAAWARSRRQCAARHRSIGECRCSFNPS